MNRQRMMIAVRRLLAEYLYCRLTQAQLDSEHAPIAVNYVAELSDEVVERFMDYLSDETHNFDLYWRWNTHTQAYEVDVLHRRK